jgi:hypothetical protein
VVNQDSLRSTVTSPMISIAAIEAFCYVLTEMKLQQNVYFGLSCKHLQRMKWESPQSPGEVSAFKSVTAEQVE